ncbi:hypothetical protein [Streptomyces sp. NPDC006551]|uniref:hypothetical protein n=1 Tax=Streptomyces sp. NPDC006551 TaxID=3157178 RepID=UPI0033A03C8C
MAPLSGDPSSLPRHLLVPVLLLLAAALVAAALAGSGDEGGEAPPLEAGPASGRTGSGTWTTRAAGQHPAPQGGIATRRPSPTPTSSRSARDPRRPAPLPSALPYHRLRAGECFDIDRSAPGTVVRRACDRPHDAQLVTVLRLTGDHLTDQDVRDAAARLCRGPLRRKAAEQPRGTRWTTFVQYPYRTSYLLGSDTVACSLATATGRGTEAGRKLTAPLL